MEGTESGALHTAKVPYLVCGEIDVDVDFVCRGRGATGSVVWRSFTCVMSIPGYWYEKHACVPVVIGMRS